MSVASMKTNADHDQRIASILIGDVYPLYLKKIERKGRSQQELLQVITWLTGYDEKRLRRSIENKESCKVFFENATMNPNAHLITGTVCGYRVEQIKNPLTRKIRYMDKLVDELAKGRAMDKILRK